MLNEERIAQALDSRLSGLTASEERRMRIRAAIHQEKREDKPVKSKKTLIVAIALAALMLTSALAVAETLNLFDFFGRQDERYAALAPEATLTISEPALIEHPHLGSVEAKIDSAYFDGLSLTIAYLISNTQHVEAYTPTAEELAQMQPGDAAPIVLADAAPGADVYQAYDEAIANGTPFGYREYSVYESDHTYTDDGIDIEPRTSWPVYDGNTRYELMEFNTPLADELRSRDSLTITKAIYQSVRTVWFDGKVCWTKSERQEVGAITATIPKAKNQVKTFSGEGMINGVKCVFTAEVSPQAAVLTLESAAPFDSFLPAAPEGIDPFDKWGSLALTDQSGREYGAQNGFVLNSDSTVTIVFDGTGELPAALTAYAYTEWEGKGPTDLSTMTGIPLTTR